MPTRSKNRSRVDQVRNSLVLGLEGIGVVRKRNQRMVNHRRDNGGNHECLGPVVFVTHIQTV